MPSVPRPNPALLQEIKKLAPAEWASLRNAGDAWFSLENGSTAPSVSTPKKRVSTLDTSAGPLFAAIADELRRRGNDGFLTLKPKHIERAEHAWAQVLRQMPRKLNAAEEHAVAKQCAFVLAKHLEDVTGIRPGQKMMLDHIGNLLTTLDRAFPGYMAAGMLSLILRKRHGTTEG